MKRRFYSFLAGIMAWAAAAQSGDSLAGKEVFLKEVIVTALRAQTNTPVTFSNITAQDIAPRNLGQDIPILLGYLPSVVSTSDAGAGVGYTGIRIRGSDATRVNVTINEIPYNDAESQGTFWVDLPDFISSTESIQLQRGVGTSTNGAGAFGASLHLLTTRASEKPFAEFANSFGSFNTRKHSVAFSTGKLNHAVELTGRLSAIASDGYIDRAFSNLKSYFLQATHQTKNSSLKALLFGGQEITYQAWNGVDAETLQTHRTFNPSGMYTDEDGAIQFYDNEVDTYQQHHFQLHWANSIDRHWNMRLAVHYTHGKGFFEQYREDEPFEEYGLAPLLPGETAIETTDLIRRRWLDNDFYGLVGSAVYEGERTTYIFGGAWNIYEGAHFGEVIWARYAGENEIGERYYDGYGKKMDMNSYVKATIRLGKRWTVFGDLQLRTVYYKAAGEELMPVGDMFVFFNPKAGGSFWLNEHARFYFSYAVAHREPNRTDYENGSPKPEQLHDIEAGWRYAKPGVEVNANLYYMRYANQLVLTGALDDVGNAIRTNSGKSYRLGVELEASLRFWKKWVVKPVLGMSTNRNRDFVQFHNGFPEKLGTTPISYSPGVVAANSLIYQPITSFQCSFLSKYVGSQYMSNTNAASSRLKAYFVHDFNVHYEWKPRRVFSSIIFSGLVNNLFNARYVSNGYYYMYDVENEDGTLTTLEGAGYYPQAGSHFLAGVTVRF